MIHKTAIVDPKAKISTNVNIGPYSIIGPNVEIGEDTDINALEDYFISVVPCQFDLTAHHSIATLNSWNIHDN